MSQTDAVQVLRISNLRKQFGGQIALDGIDFDLRAGEIHALLGENGAGKSTMIKILAGVVDHDGGEIEVLGHPYSRHPGAHRTSTAGIAFVHQDLGLIDTMSVVDNVALVTGYTRRLGLISHAATARSVAALLKRYQIQVPVDVPVGVLDQDEKVMVAVARALSLDARIIVLDEVSASLPAPQMARLARSLRQSRDAGAAYVYVTHRLEEVFDLADRVTVLRDGRVRATRPVEDTSSDEIVDWIIGSAVEQPRAPRVTKLVGKAALVADRLVADGLPHALSLTIGHGEVLGVCGLTGSGTRTVARVLAGAQPTRGGGATLDGQPLPLGRRTQMTRRGVIYVPGDRQGEGTAQDLSIRQNMYLRRGRFPGGADSWVFHPADERRAAGRHSVDVGIRPSGDTERALSSLSGGNQQKVVLARALRTRPRLLILEDPTAGVDVGARAELHHLVQEVAARGTAVLLCSSDFEEVAGQSDRVLVMNAGRLTAEVAGRGISADRLTSLSYGSAVPAAAVS